MSKRLQTVAESLYGLPQPLVKQPSESIIAKRDPTVQDTGYPLSQLWLDTVNNSLFSLVDVTAGIATWTLVGSGGTPLTTLTGDVGGPIVPVAQNINIQGGAAGAILFSSGGAGQMNAVVQVDGTTIQIVADKLTAVNTDLFFSLTTVGAVSANTPDIPIPNNQTTSIDATFAVINATQTLGASDASLGAVRVNGGVVTVIDADFTDYALVEDVALDALDYNLVAGGGASTCQVQVIGVAGQTLNWRVRITLTSTP